MFNWFTRFLAERKLKQKEPQQKELPGFKVLAFRARNCKYVSQNGRHYLYVSRSGSRMVYKIEVDFEQLRKINNAFALSEMMKDTSI